MRRVLILVLASGCRQILGFDSTSTGIDGAVVDIAIDMSPAIDVPPDTAKSGPITIAFQQGVAGYAGARDTYLDSGSPNADNSTSAQIRWRGTDRDGLIAFDIFGATADRIPAGSTITAATLEVAVQSTASAGTIYEVLVPWQDTVTFNSFGAAPGIDLGDLGNSVAPTPSTVGTASIDVLASIAAWSLDPTKNNGWMFRGESGGGDSVFRSSNDTNVPTRPRLSVTYQP